MEKRRTLVISIPDGNHVYIPRVGRRIVIEVVGGYLSIQEKRVNYPEKPLVGLAGYAPGKWDNFIWKV